MATLTREAATDGQVEQITRVAQDAARKTIKDFALDKDGAQRVHAHGDELAEAVRTTIIASLNDLSVPDKFKNEEVVSTYTTYTYPPEYTGPKPILEQVQALKTAFPQLDVTATLEFVEKVLPMLQLPAGAEGWFAIPRWQKVAATYGEAVEKVLSAIGSKRTLKNYRQGQLGPDRLRQLLRSVNMLEEIGKQQTGDILIVPVQYGLRHRGRSVRRARECFLVNEFGLGAFAVSCMALTHPERYVRYKELDTDCAGDEYAPDAVGDFSNAPFLYFDDDRLEFGTFWFDSARDIYFGSVSAFLPQ